MSLLSRVQEERRSRIFDPLNGRIPLDRNDGVKDIRYLDELINKSITYEKNDGVVRDLKKIKERIEFLKSASECGMIGGHDRKLALNEVVDLIGMVHDSHVEEQCFSCQSLGLVASDLSELH